MAKKLLLVYAQMGYEVYTVKFDENEQMHGGYLSICILTSYGIREVYVPTKRVKEEIRKLKLLREMR